MQAAIQIVRSRHPREMIVAVPVAPPSTLEELRPHCDRVICLTSPESFFAIGQFYEDFAAVEDDEVCAVLSEFAPASGGLARS